MIRRGWVNSIFLLCVATTILASPTTTFRMESNAVFRGPDRGSVWFYPPSTGDWRESYLHELRVKISGTHEKRAGYRVEPRFQIVHSPDSAERFNWVLDQAYGYVNSSSQVTFLMGKQRTRWGTGLTFTPTDNLQSAASPLDPTRFSEGVFLARMDATLKWFSLSLLYSPDRGEDTLSFTTVNTKRMAGARLFILFGTVDLFATVFHNFDDETNLGGAFSWDAGPLVLYGEAAWLAKESGTLRHYLLLDEERYWHPRAVLGANKSIGSGSSVYAELFYTGWGLGGNSYQSYLDRIQSDADQLRNGSFNPSVALDYANLLLLTRPAQELHQWYGAVSGVYNVRNLWTVAGNFIIEPVDQTFYGYPLITYLGYPNVDIVAGFSFATGTSVSELPILPFHYAADFRFVIHF